MSIMTVSPVSSAPVPAPSIPQSTQAAQNAPAARTDVIDLSKPPTPEQAERLRNAGILGYGSISAQKSLTSEQGTDGSRVTHFSVDYSFEYFDLVNKTVVKHASSGAGVFTADGSAAAFHGVTTQLTFDASRYWTGQLGQTADQLAASHQAKVSYLEVSFTGKERDSRLSELDSVYRQAKEEAVSSFTQLLGRFLDKTDRASREQELRGSVQAVFARYEAKYQSVAINKGPDGWLGATLYESTVNLQKLGLSFQSGGSTGPWSLEELDFAAVSVSAFHAALSASQSDGEGKALHFHMAARKVEAMSVRGQFSQNLVDFLQLTGQNARRELLGAAEETPEKGGLNLFA